MPLPGFDLANSPVEIEQLDLRGRTVYQRTTAGTQGGERHAALPAAAVYTGFATARATAAYLRRHYGVAWHFVVTGDEGRAAEDGHGGIDRGDVDRCLEADRFNFIMKATRE